MSEEKKVVEEKSKLAEMPKPKRMLFNITGGIGRCIAFTGVMEEFKRKNPDTQVNVLTGFPDVYVNNPSIERIYPFNTPYLYEDVILNMDYSEPEPYKMRAYYADSKHIIDCFNKETNGEAKFVEPKLYFSDAEEEGAKNFIAQQEKEVVLIQPFGSMGGHGMPDTSFRSLKPDFAEKLMRKLGEKYKVFMIKDDSQKGFKGIDMIRAPVRAVLALIPHVKAIIGVDSFLQHAAFACKKQSFVFWTSTREGNLGYDFHKNYRNNTTFTWTPVRIFMNDPNIYEKNKHVNEFNDKDMQVCLDWVETQKQTVQANSLSQDNQQCNTCK